MLAPLPRLHRLMVAAIVLVAGLGAGLVLAQVLPLPAGGVLVGAAIGCLLGFLLIHDFHHPAARHVRVTRRR